MISISVIICAYNEEKNLKAVIEEAIQVLDTVTSDFELIIMDDGSTDNTLQVARLLGSKDDRIKIIVHVHNQGIGSALLDSFKAAQKEYVTWLPADGQISTKDIKLFADNIQGYDLVVSYYIKRPVSLFRKLTSGGVRFILFILFGKTPRYDGTYMFRRQILNDISLKMDTSFVLNYELVMRAQRQGFKIKEVPTVCLERSSGTSKVLGVKKILFVFSQILELRFKHF